MDKSTQPRSFAVSPDATPVKRRAIFSSSAFDVNIHHVDPDEDRARSLRPRRRKLDDDSLRLIDDLTNRPMDPLFLDSRLMTKPRSALSMWATRVIVFIICVGVGFLGCLFIQQLNTDPRKAIRQSLAAELMQQKRQASSLTSSVSSLRAQVDQQSKKLSNSSDPTLTNDEMASGQLAVKGEGIALTLANPAAANGGTSNSHIRVISDADLQQFVSLLWKSGAEAIAINGYRLGVQTSVRLAGQTILVGVYQVQSPYILQAIGNKNALADAVGATRQASLYESFKQSGIYPQVQKNDSITLEAAGQGNVTYARRSR